MPAPPSADERPSPSDAARRALWSGALAGLLVGAGDAIASWERLGQFLPSAGGRLAVVLFAGLLLAAALGLAAAATATGVVALLRGTALGALLRHGHERHVATRAADPRAALTGLAVMLAAGPLVAGALGLAWAIGLETLRRRHHQGLVVAAIMALTLGLLGAAVVAAFPLGRLLEAGLRRLPGRLVGVLSHPLAPPIALAALLGLAGALAAFAARRTLAVMPLRPAVVLTLAGLACGAALPAADRALRALGRAPRAARLLAHAALVALPLAGALLLGADDAVRKAASAHTALSGPIAAALQAVTDVDRDGYASILGGGDCAMLDGDVHPGALDVPEDGVDQNCLGGDVRLARAAAETFTPLPAGVPRDANVLLVTIDTLRADHVGAYGATRPTTPALDALAARGGLFLSSWAHAPSTRYSIPAILTGRYPSQVLWDTSVWWPAIRPESRTLAEILRDRGLFTGAILNYSYFDRVRGMAQGFHTYDNSNARLHVGRDPASTRGSSSREQADAAIRWLEAHGARRFFLWVHFYDPHFEYERHPGTPDFGDDPRERYDHEIRFTDDQIARVLAHLRELGLEEKTIVAVTGDHGEGFGERGIQLHGYHLYAAQTRVPLIVRVPGLAGRRITTPVGHVDLLPTLANLVGAPPERGWAGRSLVPELAGTAPADGDRDVFQEVSFEGPTERHGLVTRDWHLLYNRIPDNTFELYDLRRDPGETRDVWGAHGAALRDRLLAWIDAASLPPEAVESLAGAFLAAPPRPALPVQADLGGAVRLLGLDVEPRAVRAGEDLRLTWYLESLRRLSGRWRLFVHVEGAGGRFLGDHDPVGGALPLARLRPGQLVADRQVLRVPLRTRPGAYTIYFGIYERARRLPVTAAGAAAASDDRVLATTITVLPAGVAEGSPR